MALAWISLTERVEVGWAMIEALGRSLPTPMGSMEQKPLQVKFRDGLKCQTGRILRMLPPRLFIRCAPVVLGGT